MLRSTVCPPPPRFARTQGKTMMAVTNDMVVDRVRVMVEIDLSTCGIRNPAVLRPIQRTVYFVGCPAERMDAVCNGKGGARADVA